jgi:Tol biopolymer transport system component
MRIGVEEHRTGLRTQIEAAGFPPARTFVVMRRSFADLPPASTVPSDPTGLVSRNWIWAAAGVIVVAFAAGIFIGQLRSASRNSTPPSIRYLTYSGRDYSPAASFDGKRVCFSSDRDGTKRIWVKDLVANWETPLTGGPDDLPRFSRDGSMVLFTRTLGPTRALFRIPSIGGEPSKIVDDVLSGDWSPDGRQVVFVRWSERGSTVCLAATDGSKETVLHHFPANHCSTPRWSPDGASIAVAINDRGRPSPMH